MCAKSSKESRNQECTEQQWTMWHKGKISATAGSSPAFPMMCLPMPMLMPLFFRRIVLLPLSCCCRATLTSVQAQPQAEGNVFPVPLPLLAFSSLPFPCSVVAKCNHCNRFCTISNVHSALKTLLLWLSARFLGVAAV